MGRMLVLAGASLAEILCVYLMVSTAGQSNLKTILLVILLGLYFLINWFAFRQQRLLVGLLLFIGLGAAFFGLPGLGLYFLLPTALMAAGLYFWNSEIFPRK